MTNTAYQNKSILKETVEMLGELNDYELQAVQSIIRVIITKQDEYYRPLSEKELFSRIDRSLEQVDAGLAIDSELVEKELISEFGL